MITEISTDVTAVEGSPSDIVVVTFTIDSVLHTLMLTKLDTELTIDFEHSSVNKS